MKNKKLSLDEISVFIRNGVTIKQNNLEKQGYPITRIETIASGVIDETRMGYAGIFEKEKYREWFLEDEDILISHINSEKHLGKSAIYIGENDRIIHGMNLLCLRVKKEIVLPKYLYFYFKSLKYKVSIGKISKKSVNQASFSIKDFKEIELEIPNIEIQKKIVLILDKLVEILKDKKEILLQLDELNKCLFFRVINRTKESEKEDLVKNWKEIFNVRTGKLDSNAMIENGKYPFFTCAKEIFRINDYAFDCEALLLAGNNAAGVYDVKYYKGKFNAYQRTYVLELKNKEWHYKFFKQQLEEKLLYLKYHSKGTNTRYLTLEILNKLNFIVPSLQEQQKYENYITKIEKSKFLLLNFLKIQDLRIFKVEL